MTVSKSKGSIENIFEFDSDDNNAILKNFTNNSA